MSGLTRADVLAAQAAWHESWRQEARKMLGTECADCDLDDVIWADLTTSREGDRLDSQREGAESAFAFLLSHVAIVNG